MSDQKRVLVIDNEPLLPEALKRLIGLWAERRGVDVQVETYTDGWDALPVMHQEPLPDLIIADDHMPRVDGMDLLHLFRARSDAPFILMSVNDPAVRETRELAMARATFLAKPMDTDDFFVRLDQALLPAPKRAAVVTDDNQNLP